MLHNSPDLPDDPTPQQVDAWVELAELVNDPGFRHAGSMRWLRGSKLELLTVNNVANDRVWGGVSIFVCGYPVSRFACLPPRR